MEFWTVDPVAADAERRRRVALLAEEEILDATDDGPDCDESVMDGAFEEITREFDRTDHVERDPVVAVETLKKPSVSDTAPAEVAHEPLIDLTEDSGVDLVLRSGDADVDVDEPASQRVTGTRLSLSSSMRTRLAIAAAVISPLAVFAVVYAVAGGEDAPAAGPAIPEGITTATALCTSTQDAISAVVFGLPGGQYAAGALPGPGQIPSWEIGGQTVALTPDQVAALPTC